MEYGTKVVENGEAIIFCSDSVALVFETKSGDVSVYADGKKEGVQFFGNEFRNALRNLYGKSQKD